MGILSIDTEWVVIILFIMHKKSICIHKIVMSKKANIEISS